MSTHIELLNHAEHLARKKGMNGFSYADLSLAVGIQKASIHHHFPKKADLALAVIERYAANFFDQLDAIRSKALDPDTELKNYVAIYRAALMGGEGMCLCVAYASERESHSQPVRAALKAFHVRNIDWLSPLFVTRDEATSCLACVEGAQVLAHGTGEIFYFDHATCGLRATRSA